VTAADQGLRESTVGNGAWVGVTERHIGDHAVYLQVEPDTDIASWTDTRIWDELAVRLGHGQDGWKLTPGPIIDKSVLPMRSFVTEPTRHGRLFLAREPRPHRAPGRREGAQPGRR
jgi:hypothetical protein